MKNKFMTTKKALMFGFLTAITTAAIAIASISQASFAVLQGANNQCAVCSGNHYTSNYAIGGKGHNRVKEYWVCCTCHNHYLSTDSIPGYKAENFKDAGMGSLTNIPTADDRVYFGGTEKTYNINKLTTGTITVDGVRDSSYDAATKYNFASGLAGVTKMTATLEAVWKDDLIYIFIDVKDENLCIRDPLSGGEWWIEWDDAIQLQIDTLHSEELATDKWNGTADDASNYRGQKAAEGFYKCCAGISDLRQGTIQYKSDSAKGAYMHEWRYLSALQISDQSTYMASALNKMEDGYTYEFCLNTGFAEAVVNNVIGLNILLFDRRINTTTGGHEYDGLVPFEATNWDNGYLRSYSNFLLVGRGE